LKSKMKSVCQAHIFRLGQKRLAPGGGTGGDVEHGLDTLYFMDLQKGVFC